MTEQQLYEMAQVVADLIPYLGAALTLFIWGYSKVNTKNLSLQITYILFFLVWILYSLTDDKSHNVLYYMIATRIIVLGILITLSFYAYKTTIVLDKLKKDLEEQRKNKAVLQHEYIPVINSIVPDLEINQHGKHH